ncbi:hypothetical protein F4818DRAFT_430766 [Hypoxylon cercidicola]|nr:hypothetical protein F4818DRAFT_430766 [Hypoxylon cercidicola]
METLLKSKICSMFVGLDRFYEVHFGDIEGLEAASETVFAKCTEGSDPLFGDGWKGYPPAAEKRVFLNWFVDLVQQLSRMVQEQYAPVGPVRQVIAQPTKPLVASKPDRKLDFGFAVDSETGGRTQILIPGKLKSHGSDDKHKAWFSIGRYAKDVLCAQETRRFVMAFTLCGSLMRIWKFDRLGGIASGQFDINKDGHRFVSTILGFLRMNGEQLGFDPTIITSYDRRYIEIERNGSLERLIIDGVIKRATRMTGRATTCWLAHNEKTPDEPLVIKDSWQYRDCMEGALLSEATSKGVVHLSRCYHQYTIEVSGAIDDVRRNVRKGLDFRTADNYRPIVPGTVTWSESSPEVPITANRKRPASVIDAPLPPRKRTTLPNRVHRRIILSDHGDPIFMASSRKALLDALDACIEGHRSLYKAGILHRDISVNNLLINEWAKNPSERAFLIDLDMAVKWQQGIGREQVGTKPYMAIGVLMNEQHTFMHDLESFFWVLFWICIHYEGPGIYRGDTIYSWKYERDTTLATTKLGTVASDKLFDRIARKNFTRHFQPLVPWVDRLRKVVFPDGCYDAEADENLYSRMQDVLREAQDDPAVLRQIQDNQAIVQEAQDNLAVVQEVQREVQDEQAVVQEAQDNPVVMQDAQDNPAVLQEAQDDQDVLQQAQDNLVVMQDAEDDPDVE